MNTTILERIKAFNKGREKEPLQLKYKAMAESPFRFFRGSCGLFYEELVKRYPFSASPLIWACGDLHLENFGSYKGSSRLVYFDLNDFDEALLAPALWELCRLTSSVQIAAAELRLSKKEAEQLINTLLYYYRQLLKKGKPVVIERDVAKGLIKRLIAKVKDRKDTDLVNKRTDAGNPDKLQTGDKLLALPKTEKKPLIQSFNQWLKDNGHDALKVIDAGFRIAGTGSIGVKRYMLLAEHSNSERKVLIDVKQALPSAVAAFVNIPQPSWTDEAARIISVQEMVQHVSPAFLTAFQYNEKWFVVKELQPTTDKINLQQLMKQPGQVENYVANLGLLTASGQLRSSGRKGAATADELFEFAADDKWEEKIKIWTAGYAEQVQEEYAIYLEAYNNGYFEN